MKSEYQARWTSKQRLDAVRKAKRRDWSLALDSFNGWLIVEPKGSGLGDGPVLSRSEADYELRPVWCSGAKAKLREARRLLGLDADAVSEKQLADALP
jgi:hypothetical protein